MYAASYNDEHTGVSLPNGYSGTMLQNEEQSELAAPPETPHEEPSESVGLFSGLLGGNVNGLFGGKGLLGDFKLGSEEILIIAAAAFLLFSGTRDFECLIMLLVLLFIK